MKPFKFSRKKRDYIKWGKNIKEVRIAPKTAAETVSSGPLQADMNDASVREVYANMAAIVHTETEFVFDFIFLQPSLPKAKVRTRVISGAIHARRLCAALRKNLEQYEARFGRIKI